MSDQRDDIQEETFSVEMLQEMLIRAENEISTLKTEVKELREQQVTFRDHIAVTLYPKYIEIHSNYEKACVDAYAATDALLKLRDTGQV